MGPEAAAALRVTLAQEVLAARVGSLMEGMGRLALAEAEAVVGPHIARLLELLLVVAGVVLACSGLVRLGLAEQEQRHLLLGLSVTPTEAGVVLAAMLVLPFCPQHIITPTPLAQTFAAAEEGERYSARHIRVPVRAGQAGSALS
jgi:hypothetical protein